MAVIRCRPDWEHSQSVGSKTTPIASPMLGTNWAVSFIPMYQREAMWLSFGGSDWCPSAVKVDVGNINAITGKRMHKKLNRTRQNYLVTPDQPWLDGIKAGDGFIRQFVAMPLGGGYTVEEQITGKAEYGGMQLIVYAAKEGEFQNPYEGMHRQDRKYHFDTTLCSPIVACSPAMGLGAGGKMEQKIYPDEYGVDVWDTANCAEVYVHIANSSMFERITGEKPPETPISAETYTEYSLPWFELYDEYVRDLAASDELAKVKTVDQMDATTAINDGTNKSITVNKGQVLGVDLM